MVTELLGVTLPTQEYAGSTVAWRNAPQMHLNQHPALPLNPSLPLPKTMAKHRGVIFLICFEKSFKLWCFIPFFELDCKIGNGETYRGKISITILGVTCQAWSAQSPHEHNSFTEETHGDKGLESNVSVCVSEKNPSLILLVERACF